MRLSIFFCLLVGLLASCKKQELHKQNLSLECDEFIEENSNKFNQFSSAFFHIDTIFLDGNCLNVTIGSSGCDGSTWNLDLVDSESVAESYPVQRFSKLCFTNNEACLAYFTKDYSFDLQPIQSEGDNRLYLGVEDWSTGFLYEY